MPTNRKALAMTCIRMTHVIPLCLMLASDAITFAWTSLLMGKYAVSYKMKCQHLHCVYVLSSQENEVAFPLPRRFTNYWLLAKKCIIKLRTSSPQVAYKKRQRAKKRKEMELLMRDNLLNILTVPGGWEGIALRH